MFHPSVRIGFLAHAQVLEEAIQAGKIPAAKLAETQRQIFNDRLDTFVTGFYLLLVLIILADSLRHWLAIWSGRREAVLHESAFVPSAIAGEGT
jgi:hypothetical protein